MKILIDENIPYVKGRLMAPAEPCFIPQDDFTPANLADADALLIRTRAICDESLLAESNVKIIATATIGTDHIDIPWCENHGIKVCNAPGCNAPAVAQYVWSSLLRLGFEPANHRLGIVGCGNVGSIVKEWGDLLGADILISDPFRKDLENASLERILRECDAVTLHTPLTRTGEHPTFHLIGEKELSLMKPGAILVNAARGPVMDFKALRKVVENNENRPRLVIDTWEGEPNIDREILKAAEIATFHIAGYSRQGKERATRMSLESLDRFFGTESDISGLTGPYTPLPFLTPELITDSYNPFDDDRMLREHPEAFERLRHDYAYREETNAKKP